VVWKCGVTLYRCAWEHCIPLDVIIGPLAVLSEHQRSQLCVVSEFSAVSNIILGCSLCHGN